MAKISFSIADLYAQAFGYNSPAFSGGQGAALSGKPYEERNNEAPTTQSGASPYWGTDAFGREYYLPVTLGGYELPYPVISVQGRKTIVETMLVERQGSVRELINIDDYQIIVRGIIIDPKREFPEKVVGELASLFEINTALEIISPITERFLPIGSDGRRMAVVKSFDFPEVRGVMGVRAYSMELVSDLDFNLEEI